VKSVHLCMMHIIFAMCNVVKHYMARDHGWRHADYSLAPLQDSNLPFQRTEVLLDGQTVDL
jgi:hypothetical protein